MFSDVVLNSLLSRVKTIIIIHLHPRPLDSGKMFFILGHVGRMFLVNHPFCTRKKMLHVSEPIKRQDKIPGNGKAFCETPQLQLPRSNQNPSSFNEPLPWRRCLVEWWDPPVHTHWNFVFFLKESFKLGRCIFSHPLKNIFQPACRFENTEEGWSLQVLSKYPWHRHGVNSTI